MIPAKSAQEASEMLSNGLEKALKSLSYTWDKEEHVKDLPIEIEQFWRDCLEGKAKFEQTTGVKIYSADNNNDNNDNRDTNNRYIVYVSAQNVETNEVMRTDFLGIYTYSLDSFGLYMTQLFADLTSKLEEFGWKNLRVKGYRLNEFVVCGAENFERLLSVGNNNNIDTDTNTELPQETIERGMANNRRFDEILKAGYDD